MSWTQTFKHLGECTGVSLANYEDISVSLCHRETASAFAALCRSSSSSEFIDLLVLAEGTWAVRFLIILLNGGTAQTLFRSEKLSRNCSLRGSAGIQYVFFLLRLMWATRIARSFLSLWVRCERRAEVSTWFSELSIKTEGTGKQRVSKSKSKPISSKADLLKRCVSFVCGFFREWGTGTISLQPCAMLQLLDCRFTLKPA